MSGVGKEEYYGFCEFHCASPVILIVIIVVTAVVHGKQPSVGKDIRKIFADFCD